MTSELGVRPSPSLYPALTTALELDQTQNDGDRWSIIKLNYDALR